MARVLVLGLLLLSAIQLQAAEPATAEPEPSFQGKSRSEWIEKLKEGRNNKDKIAALKALAAMVPTRPTMYALFTALNDTSKDVRLATIEALKEFGPAAVPILVQTLREKDTTLVLAATMSLTEMGITARSAAVPLVRALQPDIIKAAREQVSVFMIRVENRDVIPLLLPLLKHRDAYTRLCAGRILTSLEAEREPVLEMYAKLAESRDREMRMLAASDLQALGMEALPAVGTVLKLLADEEAPIRDQAADALAKMGPAAKEAAGEQLLAMMKDEKEPVVRLSAAIAAWKVTRDASVPAAVRKLLTAEPVNLQLKTAQLLWWIAPGNDAIKTLREHADKENRTGELAVLLLGQIGPDAAIAADEVAGHLSETGQPMLAALALQRFGPKAKKYLPQLKELSIRGKEPLVRAVAAASAWRIGGDPKSLDPLKTLLEDKKLSTQLEAARMLVNAAPLPASFLPVLKQALESKEEPLRYLIAEALRASGETEAARTVLLEMLRSDSAELRFKACNQLGLMGADARPAINELTRLLWDPNSQVHVNAAESLGRIGPAARASVPELIARLYVRDDPSLTYSTTCEALGLIGKDAAEAIPALKTMLESPWPSVRVNAAYALWRIDGLKDGEKVLAAALKNRSGLVRGCSAEALWFIRKDPQSIPELMRLLDQVDTSTNSERYLAATALGRIGKDARAASTLLKRSVQSPDDELRHAAEEALRQIEK